MGGRYMTATLLLRHWAGIAFNLRGLVSLVRLPGYLVQWIRFARRSSQRVAIVDSWPCLADATRQTPFEPHYFYQAAWCARKLAEARPARHMDIGSDVQFIGALSAFVPTTFLDYRPLQVALRGLEPGRDDLLALAIASNTILSLSSLHVIEHIGLGRYGDPIDPDGSRKAGNELARVLAPGGFLYLSVPVGRERVCFNAHRVFAPGTVLAMLPGLVLCDFAFVDDAGALHENAALSDAEDSVLGCGLFHLMKPRSATA